MDLPVSFSLLAGRPESHTLSATEASETLETRHFAVMDAENRQGWLCQAIFAEQKKAERGVPACLLAAGPDRLWNGTYQVEKWLPELDSNQRPFD